MKHRYEIVLGEQGKQLIVREYGELDKGLFTLLHEETFESKKLRGAMKTGREAMVAALRAPHFYPIRFAADKLADAVQRVLRSRKLNELELIVDDAEIFSPLSAIPEIEEELQSNGEEEDAGELFLEDDDFGEIKGSSEPDDAEEPKEDE
jgi:hypothetical protein